MTPMQAIKAKCLDCNCGQAKEIKLCTETRCPLYAFRMGKNPNRKAREYTPEEKAKLAARFDSSKNTHKT